ncbi:MAG TPA: CDP-alcohol phosphatidyltransferase family protein [Rubricoccaceae bacterium]|jgi:phosphatidylglycerophosphate synthase
MDKPVVTPRVNEILLARFERWALPRMAARMPAWVTPDTLTFVALVGAGLTAAGYALAGDSLLWLHLASVGYVVHWWGDSLDGTLARVRDIRREKYGFFVDHQCDAISATAIFVALGAGPLMRMPIALGILVGFLLMTNLVSMVEIARGVFKISFYGGGPTELRLVMIAVNTAVWAFRNPTTVLWGEAWTAFDVFGLVAVPGLALLYLSSAARETALISRLDPRPTPGAGPSDPEA